MKYLYGNGVTNDRFNKKAVKKQFLAVAGIFALAVAAASLNFGGNRAAATVPGTNVRASLTSGGAQSSTGSYQSSISRDGNHVVFFNNQNNFAGTDTNNRYDVFVRDLANNTTVRASQSTLGVSGNDHSTVAAISETGRYVVFSSTATNLIDGRTISSSDQQLYVRDTVSGTTSILSEVSAGTFANGSTTFPFDVSSDGRFVLFGSSATNLGPTITTTGWHIHVFLLDRSTGTITWVNQASSSGLSPNDPLTAAMSCDGSFIVFDSTSGYMGVGSSAHVDVFLVDRRGGTVVTDITQSANGAALQPRISCNGNYIGFTSYANNLDPVTAGLTTGYHAYTYDRINDQFDLVDQTTGGALGNSALIGVPTSRIELSLSDNGTAIFESQATNLDAAATSSAKQVFLRDPKAGTTELLSRDSGGTEANNVNAHTYLSLSLDGKKAAYGSEATNLVSGDTNASPDVFVSDTGL